MAASSSQRSRFVTVGLKILVGVALASNLCIGALLYGNIRSSHTVEQQVDTVLQIRAQLSDNLRAAIVALQDEFLDLPSFFRIDPGKEIVTALEQHFTITQKEQLAGRETYSPLYSRKERRDIALLRPIVQTDDNTVIVSFGLTDEAGNFSESVERYLFASSDPAAESSRIREIIDQMTAGAGSGDALAKRVAALSEKIADASLEAEQTRNEILSYVEKIATLEQELQATRLQQRRFTLTMGALAIVVNMVVLFLLIRTIVEKPLSNLTKTIEKIRLGESPTIPYLQRRDQVGSLAGAIAHFRDALMDIRRENERKDREKVVLEEMFANINTTIHSLDDKAGSLVATADSLQELAITTQAQAESVAHRAMETSHHTATVSTSASRQANAFDTIQQQVEAQNTIVSQIIEGNTHSRGAMRGLSEAIQAIHAIIGTVSDITDQTKLLALNATIEAARAGSAGKGFGVVAGEVKALSLKTDQATADVMGKIKGIEQSSGVLFAHLDQIDERMQSLNLLCGNMTSSVMAQQQETSTISTMASQTTANTLTVSDAIAEVNQAAVKTRDLSESLHGISSQVASELHLLLDTASASLDKLSAFNAETHFSELKN